MIIVVVSLIVLIVTQAKRGQRSKFSRDGFHRLMENEEYYDDDYMNSCQKNIKRRSRGEECKEMDSTRKLLTDEYHDDSSSEDETHFTKQV